MRNQRGFTLIELMVVIVILGGLIALVGPNIIRNVERSRIETARAQMARMGEAVQMFHLENKRLPDTLETLTEVDDTLGEPLLDYIPSDPWDQDYDYRQLTRRKYEIICCGPDQECGTEDDLRHPIVLPD